MQLTQKIDQEDNQLYKPILKSTGIVDDFIGNYQQTFDQLDNELKDKDCEIDRLHQEIDRLHHEIKKLNNSEAALLVNK